MGTFIGVGSVDTRAYKTMADVISAFQGSLDIGTIMGIDIHSVVEIVAFRQGNQPAGDIVVVGSS